jgi:hypothetical protein
VVNNKNRFQTNSDGRNINTGQKYNFNQLLSLQQRRVHLRSLKVINKLLQRIRNVSDDPKQFKSVYIKNQRDANWQYVY